MTDVVTVAWDNYDQAISSAFQKYLSSKWFCNILLSAEGQTIPCHQELLSASSEWFESVLSSLDKGLHPIIFLKDVKLNDLQHLLNFIYNGEVSVPQDQIQGLLKTGELLKIKGLTQKDNESTIHQSKEICEEPLKDSVCFKNEELTVTTRNKADARNIENFKIARKSRPTSPSPKSTDISTISETTDKLTDSRDESSPEEFVPDTNSTESRNETDPVDKGDRLPNKAKKRRIYENFAPVYDNRQIYAADLLQTQLDYSGDDVVMSEQNDGYDLNEGVCPASGVEDCGPFKKVWSNTYLCYNLGKEILCLLCFCRFTQFKKFNLERHMRRKHPDYYPLTEQVKKKVLDVLVGRYEDLATPGVVASVPSQGSEPMVTDILQFDSIEWSSILGEEVGLKRDEEQGDISDAIDTNDTGDRYDESILQCQVKLKCDDVDHSFL